MIAEFYVQLLPTKNKWNGNIEGVRAARMTASKPEEPLSGAYVVKMRINVPKEVFLPAELPIVDVNLDGGKAAIVQLAQELSSGS